MILTSAEYAKAIDKTVFPGLQGGPLMHVIAGKAVAFGEALQPEFKDYAQRILDNAQALAQGLIQGGLPIISGGTDTHLMLVDVGTVGLSGKQAEEALDRVGITVNKNTIPGDTRPPTQASGIRVGSPAVTTRGFGEGEMTQIAELITRVLNSPDDERVLSDASDEVQSLTARFPVPGIDDFDF
jgi:glycine hydroxymethyltransferase